MATPDSSATSPSPPMAYLTQAPLLSHSIKEVGVAQERDDRKKAVQKFKARAEMSSVTRALRARLAYASFKATHNISRFSLRDLEEQSNLPEAPPASRTISAKRKAGVTTTGVPTNHYANSSPQSGGLRKSTSGLGSSTQRGNYYPTVNGSGSSASANIATTSRPYAYPASPASASPQGQSLYTSLLAPPPAKYARTIHNPSDPPMAAPSMALNSPRSRPRDTGTRQNASVKSIAEGTRAHTKGRSGDIKQATPKSKRSPKGKQKRADRRTSGTTNDTDSVDGDGDVDMKAAAALTSLLLHNHRGSASMSAGAGSASSPRSSIDGAASEAGSATSFVHFVQSSARPITDVSQASAEGVHFRPHTPVGGASSEPRVSTTPRPDPSDNEAADLMLFLATSPSPARPTTTKDRNTRDLAAFRALGSGTDKPRGRILFPTAVPPGAILEDVSKSSVGSAKPLARGSTGDASFTSSVSSIGSYMGVDTSSSRIANPTPRSDRPALNPSPSQLLPPPSLPAPRSAEPTASQPQGAPRAAQSQNPYPTATSSADFNINEFINASPSPRTSKTAASPFDPSGAPKPNMSLRADVGRKLFEEEQMRLGGGLRKGLSQETIGAPLGASIDLNS
ncbi:hypothetical protein EYR40_007726 [Pleurotus pulmonarius]|nr:hypothetical protein EYR40_007726 [Pleurotus pulmonarius]